MCCISAVLLISTVLFQNFTRNMNLVVIVIIVCSLRKYTLVIAATKQSTSVYIDASLEYSVSNCFNINPCLSNLIFNVQKYILSCFHNEKTRNDMIVHKVFGGTIRLFSQNQPTHIVYNITVSKLFYVLMHFILFEMDITPSDCIFSSLTLEEMRNNMWQGQDHWKFCGTKEPWKEILQSHKGRISISQYNILNIFNLTLKYEIIDKNDAKILYSFIYVHELFILTTDNYKYIIVDHVLFHNYFWKIKCGYGYVITYESVELCCGSGHIQLYDGDSIYHRINKLVFTNTTKNFSLQSNTNYFSSLINMILSKDTKLGILSRRMLRIDFHRSLLNFSILDHNSQVTINTNHTLFYKMYRLNNIIYPKLKVKTIRFSGLTSSDCFYGGIVIYINASNDSNSNFLQIGPKCSLSNNNEPLIGEINEVIFDQYLETTLAIYAYGPLFDINIDISLLKSEIEGIFVPLSLCLKSRFDTIYRYKRKRSSFTSTCLLKSVHERERYYIGLDIYKEIIIQNFAVDTMVKSYYVTIKTLAYLIFRMLPPLIYIPSSEIRVDSMINIYLKLRNNSQTIHKYSQNLNYTNIDAVGRIWMVHLQKPNLHGASYQLNVRPTIKDSTQCWNVQDQSQLQRHWYGNRSILYSTIFNKCGQWLCNVVDIYFFIFKSVTTKFEVSEVFYFYILIREDRCKRNDQKFTDMLTLANYHSPRISLNATFMNDTIIEGKVL